MSDPIPTTFYKWSDNPNITNTTLQTGDLSLISRAGISYKVDIQSAIDIAIANASVVIPFINLASNSSMSFSHAKNRKVEVQIYDSSGILRPSVHVDQSVLNTITISINNVTGGSLSGTLIFF